MAPTVDGAADSSADVRHHLRVSRLSALSTERVHLPLMLVLTFSTGVVDAVGYLGLDRVFTGNMTGNVVVLGMALAGGADLPVLGPLLALGGFVLGAALGGRVLERAAHVWSWLTTLLLTVVGLAVLVLGVVALVVGEPGEALRLAITTLLGAAMGLQAATARVVAVKDVTTVVVTSTLTGLAADSVLGSGKGGGTGRRLAAVVLIILGALVGGLLVQLHLGAGLLLAGVLVLLVAGTGGLHARAWKGDGSDQVSAR